jgi:hypothetical protein
MCILYADLSKYSQLIFSGVSEVYKGQEGLAVLEYASIAEMKVYGEKQKTITVKYLVPVNSHKTGKYTGRHWMNTGRR